ncbi:hypothetical protein BCR33DRAFT_796434 [Rhizoclosmatium globosum]|uniref:Uncharacterized protein n=1 Tax=Rhizoclosmatium globosum TaxID=329046 RepID=A0A1Y2ANN6_9FUNG|nr:hypothetical protein BCR33DRAFT_796434 [Rhizoclosmatium globosum]|eukprot:ORY23565.1 hypothetical protein BCR33DRAFT_796434 [Rhizoclosmatium globosum]
MQRSIIKTTTTVKRGETTLVTTIIKTTVEPSAVAVHRKHLDDKRKEFVYYHVTYLRDTEFFRTSPVLEPFKHYLDTNHTLTSEQIEAAFTKLIPVTSYEDYEVFQNRILAKGPEAQTEDILFSGKAHYFLNSSATSGGKSKLFAICADHEVEKLAGTIQLLKYQCTLFEINSLAARYIESFPVCAAATIINRLARKANGLHTDADIALVLHCRAYCRGSKAQTPRHTRMTLIADHVSYLRDTVFLKTSPVLSAFSRFLATNTNNTIDELEAAFTSLVPVTEYSDYAEMQARIVAGDLKTPNLLCPGIPTLS